MRRQRARRDLLGRGKDAPPACTTAPAAPWPPSQLLAAPAPPTAAGYSALTAEISCARPFLAAPAPPTAAGYSALTAEISCARPSFASAKSMPVFGSV